MQAALNMFMNKSKYLYRNSEELLSQIFDDLALADFSISDKFWYSQLLIEFKVTSEDRKKIEQLRSNLLSFVQNSMSPLGIMNLLLAETKSDIVNLFRQEEKMAEQRAQIQRQQALENMQLESQLEQQKEQGKFENEYAIEKMKQEYSLQRTIENKDQFSRQHDIDQNRINDANEREAAKLRVKMIEMAQNKELKERELDIKEKKI